MLDEIFAVVIGLVIGFALAKLVKFKRKYDGVIEVSGTDASQVYQLEIATDPDELKNKEQIIFQVRKISATE